jgi:hypothetical protein
MDNETKLYLSSTMRSALAAACDIINELSVLEERTQRLEETVALLSQVLDIMVRGE